MNKKLDEVFDRSKLMELVAAGDIEKVKEYLDKCGISYVIDNKSDPNKTIIMADGIEVCIHKSSTEATESSSEPNLETLVNTNIEVWVNDFKTGYSRWGLETAPTDSQVKTFREILTQVCNDTSTIKDKSENGVFLWVRAQANIAITQIKFENYNTNLEQMLNANLADLGLTTTLSAEELKQVKESFEKLYKAGLSAHVNSINAKGAHQIESNADLNAWFKELLTNALSPIKTARANATKTADTPPTEQSTEPVIDNKEAYNFVSGKVNYVSNHLPDSVRDTKSFNPVELNKTGSSATKIFASLLDDIKNAISDIKGADYLKNSIGDEAFEQLFKIAWNQVTDEMESKNVNTKDFVNAVLSKLQGILNGLAKNPENLKYYTTVVENVKAAGVNVDCRNPVKYDTGEYHLDNDKSDKQFQDSMHELLNKIYDAYPNVSKDVLKEMFYQAQKEALSAINAKGGINPVAGTHNNNISMGNVVTIVLYKFYNILATKLEKGEALAERFAETEIQSTPPVSGQTDEQNNKIKTGAAGIKAGVKSVAENIVSNCYYEINGKNTIHTEFGIDKNGKIVFQEQDTTTVYKTILTKLKSKLGESVYKDALDKLGGNEALEKLLQAAWIMAYNDFDSSKANNLKDFVNKVMNNLEKMLISMENKPELMETLTKHTSYADSTLTKDLKHYNTATTYGNDEKVSYADEVTIYTDNTVHLSQTNDDNDYQTTMNALLTRVIAKYPEIDSTTVTEVFRDAQLKAIKALKGDKFDCPYGTGNNSSRVEDADNKRNWDGRNNRDDDHFKIDMDQLVQMTLYYFDKLLMEKLIITK